MIFRQIVCKGLMGREQELAFLLERRREATRSRGGLVLVRGEAGIGKSRLLAEVAERTRSSGARVAWGHCLEFARRPYGPLLLALTELRRTPVELKPSQSEWQQFDSIERLVEAEAARSTIVLLIEDLQWADAATLKYLAHTAPRLGNSRILIVATLRTHAAATSLATAEAIAQIARRSVAEIDLERLTGDDLANFIREAIGDAPIGEAAQREIGRLGDGNPFFTEELLKNAAARIGRSGPPPRLDIGITLRTAILERVGALAPPVRELLGHAALIGRRFDAPLLARTMDVRVATLSPQLRSAREAAIIDETGDGAYAFRHALVREAIYDSMLPDDVRPMHRRIVEALEGENGPVAALAYQSWAAGDAIRAAEYNLRAADEAVAVSAHEDAAMLYGRALDFLGPDDERRAATLQRRAFAQSGNGDHAGARASFEAAAACARRMGATELEVQCVAGDLHQSNMLGRSLEARLALVAVLERPDVAASPKLRGPLAAEAARLSAMMFEPRKALAYLALIDDERMASDVRLRLVANFVRMGAAQQLGELDALREACATLFETADRSGSHEYIAFARASAAYHLMGLGCVDEAIPLLHKAIALARDYRLPSRELESAAWLALAYLLRGRVGEARELLGGVASIHTGSALIEAHAVACGVAVALALDDEAMLEAWFDERRYALRDMGVWFWAGAAANVHARRGRQAEARAVLGRAIVGALPRGLAAFTLLAVARLGDPDDAPRARATLARVATTPCAPLERALLLLFDAFVAERRGDRASARESASVAASAFRALDFPLLEAVALERSDDRASAIEIYRTCGAIGDVRRLARTGASVAPARPATRAEEILSRREREVAESISRGNPNSKIASDLDISAKTVEKHVSSIFAKLGFSSRVQVAAYVAQRGGLGSGVEVETVAD